ncbi:hypothetical protein [Bradyrhizobium yuanmingense]|uniref:hypothetical protein n=1 Tax=Bradyrhizobium yuanmingense TaxID=108015 RepID=UPI0023B95607|nr:hypothetical protein [Bradyrhizobium yuanmingense]MDF0497247.1 hypothetical protein [Bradyrhizobium yuanmingense]MDF0521057.1 hypothetical protein [Bradyrhizobium yuanmingense]
MRLAGSLLQPLPLAHWGFFLVVLVTLTAAVTLIPHCTAIRSAIPTSWWDLPARMLIGTTIVLTLTAAAFVGAKAAGVLASFPVFGTILAIVANRGAVMATQVLRGMVLTLYEFATFFFVLGLLLTTVGALPALLAAIANTLLTQTSALRLVQCGQILNTV